MSGAVVDRPPAAVAETLSLLLPATESRRRLADEGYIDLLGRGGEREAFGRHLGQRVFRSRIVPPIYERFWRPLVARSAFGKGGPRAAEEQRIALDALEIAPGDRVLDVGCGPGNYTRPIAVAAGPGGLAVGIDPSGAMLAAAVKRGGEANLAYVRGDGAALPFADAGFDAVCCIGALHLIAEPLESLEAMVRVLGPSGRLVVVATCGPTAGRGPRRAGVHSFGREELTGALALHGLEGIEQRIVRRGQFVSARKPGA